MIKRIQVIKGVGSFRNMTASKYQFQPVTIIYGENKYGKSTLCDVFRSLRENNPSLIVNRASIPTETGGVQSVKLNLFDEIKDKEETFTFKNQRWDKDLSDDVQFLIFDSNFIHRNVFTGLSIERSNYENVTQFVLGEENVKKAKNIADAKSERREINKELKELQDNSFTNIQNVEKFKEIKISDSLEGILEKIDEYTEKLVKQRDLEKNLKTTASRDEPGFLNLKANLKGFIDDLNSVLNSSFDQIHHKAKERVINHIKSKTRNTDFTETWIHNGLDQIAKDDCPFCGQSFDTGASELISLYQKVFDSSYDEFKEKILRELSAVESKVSIFRISSIKDIIDKNKAIIDQYSEIDQSSFAQATISTSELGSGIKKYLDEWSDKFEDFEYNISEAIEKKKNVVHESLDPIELTDHVELFEKIESKIEEYENNIKGVRDEIKSFKATLKPDLINEKIKDIDEKLAGLELQKQRIKLDTKCQKHTKLKDNLKSKKKEIERLEQELEKEQTKFLKQYFKEINKIFKKLGSSDFSIHKKISRRGDLPTVQIHAKYKGVKITNDKLKYFFSESDRRALALSIFWAKIELLETDQRKNTIAILDDPVTSFDDGRIEQSIRLMDRKKYGLNQIIIISHYPRYLKSFFDRTNADQNGISLLRIEKNHDGSKLIDSQSAEFVETPHQKMFRRIVDFVERKHSESIEKDLRVYLENEVRLRYQKQILENSLSKKQFGELIDDLKNIGVIKDEISYELNEFRKSLNPDHHMIRDRSDEDVRLFGNELLNFIYTQL